MKKMTLERTLSIIKPDATKRNITGQIITCFEDSGLKIVAQKRTWLTRAEAESFYNVHEGKPFYEGLCDFMCSGPIVVQVLEGDNAIEKNRDIMGATDPREALSGTIREQFAESMTANTVHGSDSKRNAEIEIAFFFDLHDIVG